jgi:lipopolysaccharide export system protein LptA
MKKLLVIFLIIFAVGLPALTAEEAPKPSATETAAPKKGRKAAAAKTESGGSAKAEAGGSPKPKGMDFNAGVTGPITTEIYADEAFFDSSKSVGIFRGHVKVNDPRFNLQSDKLTAFISKSSLNAQTGQTPPAGQSGQTGGAGQSGQGQGQGLEKAIAEGNVAVVRDRPDPNGGPPSHAVGRAESATYVAATGDVELRGHPRVQQGLNTHVATSPDTVMVINQSGQLTTHGPSRTDIRQEPKDDKKDGDKGEKSPAPSPKP